MPRSPFHLDAIKTTLAANGEMRQSALCVAMGLTAGTVLSAVQPGLRSGELVSRNEGRAVFYALAEGVIVETACEAASEPQAFNAALWADGDLDLYGAIELDDGGVRVTAKGVRHLCRLLHGQGPEE